MFKNVASQKVIVFAFDKTTNTPKTGDAANISAYISKDFGSVTQLTDTSATEMDATNAPGYYLFDISQTETNADCILLSGKSSTSNIVVVGAPATIYTVPANFTALTITSGGVTLADGVSHGGTLGSSTATLALSRLNVTSQTSNTNAITATGNGTGHGAAFTSGSGATGNGLTLLASSTNGHGLKSTGAGTGDGAELTAGASGADLDADIAGTITTVTGNVNGNVGGNVTGSVGSVVGAVGSVTGNVGGNVVGSVGSVTTVSDKTGYALTSAYDAAKTAAQAGDEMDLVDAPNGTAVTAIQNGLATAVGVSAVETDTQDIQSRLPDALTGAGNLKTDVLAISGDTTAADRLEALMDGIFVAQVNDAGATTTAFIADGFTEATNDHFNGRLITFLTGALAGQQTAITDYVGATQTFTVTALTEAPANNDFFVIH